MPLSGGFCATLGERFFPQDLRKVHLYTSAFSTEAELGLSWQDDSYSRYGCPWAPTVFHEQWASSPNPEARILGLHSSVPTQLCQALRGVQRERIYTLFPNRGGWTSVRLWQSSPLATEKIKVAILS